MQPNVLSGSLWWELKVGKEGHQFTQEAGLSMSGPGEATFHFHVLLPLDVTLHRLMATSVLLLNWSFEESSPNTYLGIVYCVPGTGS